MSSKKCHNVEVEAGGVKSIRKLPSKRDMLKIELSGKIEKLGGSHEKVTIHRNTDYHHS